VSAEVAAAVLLIAVPIAFNVAFFALGAAFDYPNILRKEPDEILRRFAAGGSGLLLRWQALLVSARAMLPLAALLAVVLAAPTAPSVGPALKPVGPLSPQMTLDGRGWTTTDRARGPARQLRCAAGPGVCRRSCDCVP
jgi:hypothetical protein